MHNISDLVVSIRKADRKDDVAFHDLVDSAMRILQLLDSDIALVFDVSRPTVARWRNGINAPHPLMREPIFAWLEQRAMAGNRV